MNTREDYLRDLERKYMDFADSVRRFSKGDVSSSTEFLRRRRELEETIVASVYALFINQKKDVIEEIEKIVGLDETVED